MVSIERPSRALRPSASTTRYVGCLVAPTRVKRIRTAMGVRSSSVVDGVLGPRSRHADDEMASIQRAVADVARDDRVEGHEERLDLRLVLGAVGGWCIT